MTKKETLFQLSRWSLRDLFPSADSAELKEAFARLEELVGAFEKRRAALKPGMAREDFLETIGELEEISLLLQRIGGFAELWFTEDTQNQAAQTLVARVEQLSAEVSNRILFFTLWWKALDDQCRQQGCGSRVPGFLQQ